MGLFVQRGLILLLYISGKYTLGDIDENIKAARRVAVQLWEQGYCVLCPHQNTANFEQDCNASYVQYLRGDLLLLERCDAVVMLPFWEESHGAKLELAHAAKKGIPAYYWGIDNLPPPTEMPELPNVRKSHAE